MALVQGGFGQSAGVVQPDAQAGGHRQRAVGRIGHLADSSFAKAGESPFGQIPAGMVLYAAVLGEQGADRQEDEAEQQSLFHRSILLGVFQFWSRLKMAIDKHIRPRWPLRHPSTSSGHRLRDHRLRARAWGPWAHGTGSASVPTPNVGRDADVLPGRLCPVTDAPAFSRLFFMCVSQKSWQVYTAGRIACSGSATEGQLGGQTGMSAPPSARHCGPTRGTGRCVAKCIATVAFCDSSGGKVHGQERPRRYVVRVRAAAAGRRPRITHPAQSCRRRSGNR